MSSIVNCYSCGEPLTSGDSCNACWEDSKDDSLKERVTFLERVAEQAVDWGNFYHENDEQAPDLAQYLREREADK